MKEEILKQEITPEKVTKALVLLPKTLNYRVGEENLTYVLRIIADDDKYEAYYFGSAGPALLYNVKGSNILEVIMDLFDKLLKNGDLNQTVVNCCPCDGCTKETDDCVKVINENNTTTCINAKQEGK